MFQLDVTSRELRDHAKEYHGFCGDMPRLCCDCAFFCTLACVALCQRSQSCADDHLRSLSTDVQGFTGAFEL